MDRNIVKKSENKMPQNSRMTARLRKPFSPERWYFYMISSLAKHLNR
uniref:Uncharacterized protein n=1 Tax=Nelumbo nucifera TaxID=4432 RepID=A0A822XWV4_NELNU|nr:TPA_asm: hypothetical protein HUJ06_025062 [Nelumbo nucifera]